MIVDTSVWIEYLAGTGSAAHLRLSDAVERDEHIVVPEVVQMELLTGGTTDAWAKQRRRMLQRFDVVALAPLIDTEEAAAIQRRCRRQGDTVRNLLDCLIAAVAVRMEEVVLHRDRDFEVIARHTDLRTIPML